MAGLFASMAIKWACDKLSALLPVSLMSPPTAAAAASSSSAVSQDLEDLKLLERTMRRINATLHDAEEHWNIHEESAKLRLKELKDLAYDAEDVVEEYEYEVNRRKVEAFEQSAGVSSSGDKRKRQEEEIHIIYSSKQHIIYVVEVTSMTTGIQSSAAMFKQIADFESSPQPHFCLTAKPHRVAFAGIGIVGLIYLKN